jgi:DNA-directed RNA polymerase II subunit RPB1
MFISELQKKFMAYSPYVASLSPTLTTPASTPTSGSSPLSPSSGRKLSSFFSAQSPPPGKNLIHPSYSSSSHARNPSSFPASSSPHPSCTLSNSPPPSLSSVASLHSLYTPFPSSITLSAAAAFASHQKSLSLQISPSNSLTSSFYPTSLLKNPLHFQTSSISTLGTSSSVSSISSLQSSSSEVSFDVAPIQNTTPKPLPSPQLPTISPSYPPTSPSYPESSPSYPSMSPSCPSSSPSLPSYSPSLSTSSPSYPSSSSSPYPYSFHTMMDLYEKVQSLPNIIPRIYLLIVVGSVFLKFGQSFFIYLLLLLYLLFS